jgi:hypothetical protein
MTIKCGMVACGADPPVREKLQLDTDVCRKEIGL